MLHLSAKYFADQINKRTNGRVKITLFPAGTLTSPDKIYDGVVTGMSEMGNTSVAYSAGRFPVAGACFVPNPSKTGWVASHMSNDFWFKFRPKENDDVHMLYLTSSGSFHFAMTKKPVYKPEDIKGLKIRASGTQMGAYVKAVGARPMNMPMSEVYEAASKGIVDGFLVPWDTQKTFRHAEVTRYFVVLPIASSAPNYTFMNLRTWNSLPKDIQDIFTQLSTEMVEVYGRAWWYVDTEGEKYFRGLGGDRKVIEIPPDEAQEWIDLLSPIGDQYIKEYTAKGFPAKEYVDYVLERAKYWNQKQPPRDEVMKWVKDNLVK